MPEIVKWEAICDSFQDGLLLGNGASIAVHPGFNYKNLYEKSCELGHVDDRVKNVFDSFNTNDFELVLRRLWQAKLVNEALLVPPGAVENAYEIVRNALIATVRSTHVSHAEAKPHLDYIYQFMQRFKTVVSLNYDLIVYWAAMHGNKTLGKWFKDAFISGMFRDDWKGLRRKYRAAGSTLYFYPHGNLVLARTHYGEEQKVAGDDNENLLDAILSKWENGKESPIFVCEGTAEHKKKAVESSSYLRKVFYEVIPDLGKSLVIYGWSLSEQDEHIVQQLQRTKVERVAVSARDVNNVAFLQHVEDILWKQGITNVVFFDAASPGCWNTPTVTPPLTELVVLDNNQ